MTTQTPPPLFDPTPGSDELGRLITAAIVNSRFRALLLANPAQAMLSGFQGQTFDLSQKDKELVLSIQAGSLEDFAQQLVRYKTGFYDTFPVRRLSRRLLTFIFDQHS